MLNTTTNQSTDIPTQTNLNSDLDFLNQIKTLDEALTDYFTNALTVDDCLTRKLVSFQAKLTAAGVSNKAKQYLHDEDRVEQLADRIITSPPSLGYLTISNALQWRLQYSRVIQNAGNVEGILRVR